LVRKLITAIVLLGVAALLFIFAWPSFRQGERSDAGQPAPDFSFTLNGRPERLSSLRGKVVVLNFWATWCPPCRDELPSLNRLEAKIAPMGATVLGISVDDDETAYRNFLEQYHVTFPTYRDPTKRIPAAYGTYEYPETYIIDRQGRIARKIIGAQDWSSSDIVAYLENLAGANARASAVPTNPPPAR
jgi:cytochrome c biogenesis protein CcmG, thiol:disulfide interchange protein DsbE